VSDPLSEPEFRLTADTALETLERALLPLADEHDFEVEQQNGVLQISFEEPTAERFIVSPNAPVRQIWLSAMARGYKLSWSAEAGAFMLDGETLCDMTERLVHEFLGTA
jgi:iron donor protein CyaY